MEIDRLIDDEITSISLNNQTANQVTDALFKCAAECVSYEGGGSALIKHPKNGVSLQIGITSAGWVFVFLYEWGVEVVFGPNDDDGQFYPVALPEYTEFPRSCFHSDDAAKHFIASYLLSGEVSLTYIPGRNLGYPFGIS